MRDWLRIGYTSTFTACSLATFLRRSTFACPATLHNLAVIQAVTRRSAEATRLWVMLGQVLLDLAACLLIAGIAARCAGRNGNPSRVFLVALWLAAFCPFTAKLHRRSSYRNVRDSYHRSRSFLSPSDGQSGTSFSGLPELGQIAAPHGLHEKCRACRNLHGFGDPFSS